MTNETNQTNQVQEFDFNLSNETMTDEQFFEELFGKQPAKKTAKKAKKEVQEFDFDTIGEEMTDEEFFASIFNK